ncbi:MAG: 4a-hydroxytetrahydrobiopterin dehydratase [Planctomycetota bacterium]
MDKLSQDAIDERLAQLPDWSQVGDSLQRTFGFDDFVQSRDFFVRVAGIAEERQHHPDCLIRYNKVTITMSTHDAGGITPKDFELASLIDQIVVNA